MVGTLTTDAAVQKKILAEKAKETVKIMTTAKEILPVETTIVRYLEISSMQKMTAVSKVRNLYEMQRNMLTI